MQPLAEPSYLLKISGADFTGWTSMEVNRSIERMSGEFRLELTRKGAAPQIDPGVAAGSECEVIIDGQLALKGYIDTLTHSYGVQGTRVTVSGRDVVGDLIDCAASVDGPFEFNNVKLDKFIEQILKPFKVDLQVLADVGMPFKRIAIQPGETAFELIERVCRYRAVLPVSDGIGGLMLFKAGGLKSPGRLISGVNILSGETGYDWKERFSLYVVKGQSEADADSSADETAGGEGRAADEMVKRYRPTVITGENQGYDMTLKQRASWQAQMARARAIKARFDVQGWYADAESKALWLPNSIVPIRDNVLSINREMLVTAVSFRRTMRGTFTTLDFSLPEAFDLPAEIEPGTDDVAGDA